MYILGSWMTTYLGKSCSFCLPRVPFVNCRQFMYLVISFLVLRAGYGIWLYQFLIIAYLFTLNTNIKRPSKYYYADTRLGQVLHARLRMECSSLNSHLYHKNIVDSPSCLCGGFESAYHFLFVCPRFAAARNSYLPSNIHNYSTRDLLFGCECKTNQQNETIFLKVQDFIVNSGRFNNHS